MINIKLDNKLREFAWNQTKIRNMGQRSAGWNGDRIKQYTGHVGENAVYNLLYGRYKNYDSGSLIEDLVINDLKCDVKSMIRKSDLRDPTWVHNYNEYQKDRPNDVLIFVNVNKTDGNIQICGWIAKTEFFKKAVFKEKGQTAQRGNSPNLVYGAGNYEIQQQFLNKINSLDDIKNISITS